MFRSLFCVFLICGSAYGGVGVTPAPVAVPQEQTIVVPPTCSPKVYTVPQQVAVPQVTTQQRIVMRPQVQTVEVEQQRTILEPKVVTETIQQEVTTYVPEVVTEEVAVPQAYQYVPQCVPQTRIYGSTNVCCPTTERLTYLQRAVLNSQRNLRSMESSGRYSPFQIRIAKRCLLRLIRKMKDAQL